MTAAQQGQRPRKMSLLECCQATINKSADLTAAIKQAEEEEAAAKAAEEAAEAAAEAAREAEEAETSDTETEEPKPAPSVNPVVPNPDGPNVDIPLIPWDMEE